MKCFFTFAVAAAFAVGMNATLWSQTGGTAGASGGTSAGSAGAGTAGAGTAGTNGTAGTSGATGTAGTGTAGTAGLTPPAVNRAAAGNIGVGTPNTTAGPANANVGINRGRNFNSANAAQFNGQDSFPNQTPFFSDPGVRQQLSLNDTQFNTLNTAYQDAYARYNQAVNNLSPALTPEQRAVQMQGLQQQFNQSLGGITGNTFTNPQTRTRFNQLNRQFAGFNGFNDPAIRQQLNLTPDQVRQLRTLQGNWRQQLQQFRQGAGNNLSTSDTTRWNQMLQQYGASLNNVLTPQQQQVWTQMSGQPYAFSPNVFTPQPLPDGNVANVNATPPVGTAVPRGQVNVGAGTTTQGTQVPRGTQTPTGTQPTTQGTTAPATASGTSTQGGTVR